MSNDLEDASQKLQSCVPQSLKEITQHMHAHGFEAWIVGGCVRDTLLGRKVNDWDLATNALPEEVVKLFSRVIPTGIAHGTVTVLWKGDQYEVTTLRGEGSYSDGRRPDSVVFLNNIDEDLRRRDFTINAIAFDMRQQCLIDPFAGFADLERRLIRAVDDPVSRFNEDALRIMRAARFAAQLTFDLDPATERALAITVANLQVISKERIRDELFKIMCADQPSRGLIILLRCGAIELIAPQLVSAEQTNEEPWTLTLKRIDLCSKDPLIRFAASLWQDDSALGAQSGDVCASVEIAEKWLKTYRFSNNDRALIIRWLKHRRLPTLPFDAYALRRFLSEIGLDALPGLIELWRAHYGALGRDSTVSEIDRVKDQCHELQRSGSLITSTRDLAIRGEDIMHHLGIPPGKTVGDLLRRLYEAVLQNPELNQPDRLVALLNEWHN